MKKELVNLKSRGYKLKEWITDVKDRTFKMMQMQVEEDRGIKKRKNSMRTIWLH